MYKKAGKAIFLCILIFITPFLTFATPIMSSQLGGNGAAQARARLISSAEAYLGVPYRYGGMDRRGMDCSGFVSVSFRDALSQNVPRTVIDFYNWVEKIPNSELQAGDLVFFVTVGNRVSHMGIYAGGGWFIHSASEGPNTGVIYSNLEESYWRRTYLGAGRALPLDRTATAAAIPEASAPAAAAPAQPRTAPASQPNSTDSGFFSSFGASWIWGNIFENSAFRGISGQAIIGYSWDNYLVGLQFSPAWDSSVGALYLPFAFNMGSNTLNIFGGPVYVIKNAEDNEWLWEFGILTASTPMTTGRGALSLYAEICLQTDTQFKSPGIRLTSGLRYRIRL